MRAIFLPVVILLAAGGVWWFLQEKSPDVVLYCAVDADQSQPIATAFGEEKGLRVGYEGEIEPMRSVGLARRLVEEASRPRGDVFWNNEIMTTIHLGQQGILDVLPAGVAEEFPPAWRDPEGRYVAFGARARILLVNTQLLPDPKDHPTSVEDLLDPRYRAMGLLTCMARPEVGTTFTHATALLTKDEAKARKFFEDVAKAGSGKDATVRLVSGNGPAMDQARDATNKVAFALTDTDDAYLAIQKGAPVKVVYPDQGDGRPGTLVIPNTVALVKGRPHAGDAPAELLRYLVSAKTERALAFGPSAQIPLRPGVEFPEHVKVPGKDFRAMDVEWQSVGKNRDKWRDWLQSLFHRP
jgi:iron(III) transport system substrate-binding protein